MIDSSVVNNQVKYARLVGARAQEVGYKAANLEFLRTALSDVESCQIPQLTAIDSAQIIAHLAAHADNWKGLWDDFIAKQGGGNELNEQAKATLHHLQ